MRLKGKYIKINNNDIEVVIKCVKNGGLTNPYHSHIHIEGIILKSRNKDILINENPHEFYLYNGNGIKKKDWKILTKIDVFKELL